MSKYYNFESGEGSILLNIFPFSIFGSIFNYVVILQISFLNITIGFSLDINDNSY